MVNEEKRNNSKEKAKKKKGFPYKRRSLREQSMNKRGGIFTAALSLILLVVAMILIWNFFGLELPSKPVEEENNIEFSCEELRECILLNMICDPDAGVFYGFYAQKQDYKEECLNK